jgi:enoyl-CoA hydratase
MTEDVLTQREGRAGRITMNRPKALNALTHAMDLAIERALENWRHHPEVALILMDAVGDRAFCAGGDIAEIYEMGRKGDFGFARRFWADEFRLNAAIGRYPKPVVVLMNGYVLGGGVGLSGHASHRIVGESSRVAMPECAIGYVPDVGGTHLLGRAPGRLGEYLGLTGRRMGPADAILAGFADVFVPEARWPELAARLIATGDVDIVAEFAADPPEGELAARREAIDDAFSAPDLKTLVARLESSDWGHETLLTLAKQSPLSMAATLELVRASRRDPGLEAALARELRAGVRILEGGDMMEGVRAQVVDKDRNPQWADTIDSVSETQVAALLEPLGADELKLPMAD